MQEMILDDIRETGDFSDYEENDPLNAIIVIVAGSFYSELPTLIETSDTEELKKAFRSQINMLKGLYKRL